MAGLYDIPVKRADGSATTLRDYAGQALLIVNVASKCGFTKQYEGLEQLYRDYRDRGLTILGFPSNDFAGQEPGSDTEIQDFCRLTYGVDFPVFSKITVKGDDKHPLYRLLTAEQKEALFPPDSGLVARLSARGMQPQPGEVTWNFEKFVIDRKGRVIGRFSSDITPTDPALLHALEQALAA